MKSTLISLAAMFVFIGCGLANSDYYLKNYEVGVTKESSVGEPMISEEYGRKNDVYNTVLYNFSQQLIYGGIANGIAKISYREFGNNYARPAFSQELQYDLNQSRSIVFRSLKIAIVDASNESIRFKVVEGSIRLESDVVSNPVSPRGVIGVSIHKRAITRVFPGSPAEKAGLRVGDLINSVDGIELTRHNSSDIDLLGGKPDTVAHVSITRDGEVLMFDIPRIESTRMGN